MGKINAKAIGYVLLPLLLLQLSSLAGAVNLIFYSNTNGCNGNAIGCYNVGPNVCCTASASQGGSVLVSSAGSNVLSKVYRNGGCSTNVGTGPGRSNICYVGGAFTGVFYYNGRRRSLLADPTTCDTQMEPNSVIFTEDSTKGHWILSTSKVDQLYSEMQTVPDAEKADWLKSRGSFLKDAKWPAIRLSVITNSNESESPLPISDSGRVPLSVGLAAIRESLAISLSDGTSVFEAVQQREGESFVLEN